jgi:tetratricopeptide (TPR) repeat protein
MTDRLTQLQKLHDADPADPFCTYGIAIEHAKAGRRDEAVTWLEKTIAADPAYCYAYYQLGKTLAEMERPADARAALERGLDAAARSGDQHARDELAALLETITD